MAEADVPNLLLIRVEFVAPVLAYSASDSVDYFFSSIFLWN